MKAVVVLGVILVVLGAGIWWFVMHESMKDMGYWIAAAYGNEDDPNIEMHVLVDLPMVTKDRPDLDARGEPLWNEWVQSHFELRDAAGAVVPGERIG
jgi:hypothetical protein